MSANVFTARACGTLMVIRLGSVRYKHKIHIKKIFFFLEGDAGWTLGLLHRAGYLILGK